MQTVPSSFERVSNQFTFFTISAKTPTTTTGISQSATTFTAKPVTTQPETTGNNSRKNEWNYRGPEI